MAPTLLFSLRSVLLSVVAAMAVAAGCGGGASRFAHLQPSEHAAAEAVVRALATRDVTTLEALAVSEDEFMDTVWPALPTSRPEFGMPPDYVWSDTHTKSRGYLGQALEDYGGQPMTVERVRFLGATTDYGTFRIHAKTVVSVRHADGRTEDLRLFGSLLEAGGQWKVYSYIVD
ncbi:MAG: hypothetical protein R2752_14785 [Vicinamibacterales bacterium]